MAIMVAGCGGNESSHRGYAEELFASKPPAFLVGPASVFLTNSTSFSARVTLDTPGDANKSHQLVGQLLGSGPQLVFSPEHGDRTCTWNVRDRSGYVLSEALQGYAPLTSPIQVTNIITTGGAAGPGSDRVNGHRGHEVEVSVASNDGSTANFNLWLADDLKGFPVRISALSGNKPFVLNLTDVKPAVLSSNLFFPPDGFTKFATPEIMASELMMRRSRPKIKDSSILNEPSEMPQNYYRK